MTKKRQGNDRKHQDHGRCSRIESFLNAVPDGPQGEALRARRIEHLKAIDELQFQRAFGQELIEWCRQTEDLVLAVHNLKATIADCQREPSCPLCSTLYQDEPDPDDDPTPPEPIVKKGKRHNGH